MPRTSAIDDFAQADAAGEQRVAAPGSCSGGARKQNGRRDISGVSVKPAGGVSKKARDRPVSARTSAGP